MNKKLLFISIIAVDLFLLTSCNNKKEDIIPVYDSNIVCTKEYKENIDDDVYTSKNIIYIYEKDSNLSRVIKQVILTPSEDFIDLTEIASLYDEITGIDSSLNNYGENIVWQLTFNFDKLDLGEFKNTLGGLLDEKSILSTSNLPIKTSDYLEKELNEYKCEGV